MGSSSNSSSQADALLDVDTDDGAPTGGNAGPAPRITIRYNDPGSLESLNEDNLFFCLEADSKNEFRERLEKTIHVRKLFIRPDLL